MGGVEQPLKVNLLYVADNAVHNKLTNLGLVGSVSVVEGNAKISSGALHAVDDLLALLCVNGHGLFRDNVATALHSLDDVLVVGAVNRGNDNYVGLGLLDHLFKVLAEVGRNCMVAVFFYKHLVSVVHSTLIYIAKSDQLGVFPKISDDCAVKHSRSAANTDLGVSLLFHV